MKKSFGELPGNIGNQRELHLDQLGDGLVEATEIIVNAGGALRIIGPLSVQPGGTQRTLMRDKGVFTDYSVNALPRVFAASPGAYTLSAADTWETDDSAYISAPLGLYQVSFTATAVAYAIQTSSTTSRDCRMRMRYSLDGGATWTTGPSVRFDDLTSTGTSRANLTCTIAGMNKTLTDSLQIQVQYYATHTEVTFNEGEIIATVVGDI